MKKMPAAATTAAATAAAAALTAREMRDHNSTLGQCRRRRPTFKQHCVKVTFWWLV